MPNLVRLFDNAKLIPEAIINDRLQALDATSLAIIINMSGLTPSGTLYSVHLVSVDSPLTDAQIVAALSTAITDPETATLSRLSTSKANAKAILSWATWTEAQAQTWGATNIGTPLSTGRSALPVTLTLTTARTAIIMLLNILDQMWAMQWALTRMVIAIRDKTWPDLPQT